MITDLEIAIEWIKTGRPPNDKRGIYGSTALEPMVLNSIADCDIAGLAKNPFDLMESQIDIDIEQGKKNGFNPKETHAYLKWVRARKKRQAL